MDSMISRILACNLQIFRPQSILAVINFILTISDSTSQLKQEASQSELAKSKKCRLSVYFCRQSLFALYFMAYFLHILPQTSIQTACITWSQNIDYYIVPFNAAQATKGRTGNLHVAIMDMNSSKLYAYSVKIFSLKIYSSVTCQDKDFVPPIFFT